MSRWLPLLLLACATPDGAPDLTPLPLCDAAVDVLSAEDTPEGLAWTAWRDAAFRSRWALSTDTPDLPAELLSPMLRADSELPTQLYQREQAQPDGSCSALTSAADRVLLPELGGAMGLSCSLWGEVDDSVHWRLRCPLASTQEPLADWLEWTLWDLDLASSPAPGLLLFLDGTEQQGRFELRLDSDGANVPARVLATGSVGLPGGTE